MYSKIDLVEGRHVKWGVMARRTCFLRSHLKHNESFQCKLLNNLVEEHRHCTFTLLIFQVLCHFSDVKIKEFSCEYWLLTRNVPPFFSGSSSLCWSYNCNTVEEIIISSPAEFVTLQAFKEMFSLSFFTVVPFYWTWLNMNQKSVKNIRWKL